MQTTTNSSHSNLTKIPTSSPTGIEVIEVKSRRHLKDFLSLPRKIYSAPDTKYVYPLNLHLKMMMGKLGTPQKHFFIAKKNGTIVARIGAKVHKHGDKTSLNFGFFECIEGHKDATIALVKTVHSLYPDLKMYGPYHFRMEDPYIGTLVEGYDLDPFFLMSYNPPYYDEYLQAAGLSKAMDLFTYQLKHYSILENADVIHANAQKAKDAGVTIRSVDKSKLHQEARDVARIFNDALSKNWGFEEFLEEQINEMVMMFKLFLDTDVVTLAIKDGKTIGCLIMIPNYNPMVKPYKGRFTPGFLLKYLNRKKYIHDLRGYALGVLQEAHGLGIGSYLVEHMFSNGPAHGYDSAEISWVLSNNGPMNELSKAMGGKHNKVYRVYEKVSLKNTN